MFLRKYYMPSWTPLCHYLCTFFDFSALHAYTVDVTTPWIVMHFQRSECGLKEQVHKRLKTMAWRCLIILHVKYELLKIVFSDIGSPQKQKSYFPVCVYWLDIPKCFVLKSQSFHSVFCFFTLKAHGVLYEVKCCYWPGAVTFLLLPVFLLC